MARSTVPVPPQARQSAEWVAWRGWTRMVDAVTIWVAFAASALRRSCQRVIVMAAQVMAASATTRPVVSAARRITSKAVCTILATTGPILAATSAATMMTATAAMPVPWPPESLQHGGLHMTGRRRIGSVKHATHLISRMGFGDGFVWLAGLEGGCPPGPAPAG